MFAMAAFIVAEIDQGGRSPNVAAGIAGFALLSLWVLVALAQVLRHRRRRRFEEQGGSDSERSAG